MLRLFVGNLPHACAEDGLRQWFEERGHEVVMTQVIRDRITSHSRGFGFVELADTTDLDGTVHLLSGQSMSGRILTVGAANPKLPRHEVMAEQQQQQYR